MLELNAYLVVELPGERVRAVIREIITEQSVVVELITTPMAKSHSYKLKDLVPCSKIVGFFGDKWVSSERIITPVPEKKEPVIKTVPEKKETKKTKKPQKKKGKANGTRKSIPTGKRRSA